MAKILLRLSRLVHNFYLSLIKLNLKPQRGEKFPQVVFLGFSLEMSDPGSAKSATEFKDLNVCFHWSASFPFGHRCLAGVGLMCPTCDVVKY